MREVNDGVSGCCDVSSDVLFGIGGHVASLDGKRLNR
jgi:hypothetical protein